MSVGDCAYESRKEGLKVVFVMKKGQHDGTNGTFDLINTSFILLLRMNMEQR